MSRVTEGSGKQDSNYMPILALYGAQDLEQTQRLVIRLHKARMLCTAVGAKVKRTLSMGND